MYLSEPRRDGDPDCGKAGMGKMYRYVSVCEATCHSHPWGSKSPEYINVSSVGFHKSKFENWAVSWNKMNTDLEMLYKQNLMSLFLCMFCKNINNLK